MQQLEEVDRQALLSRINTLEELLEVQRQCVMEQADQLQTALRHLQREHRELGRRATFLEMMQKAVVAANQAECFQGALSKILPLLADHSMAKAIHVWRVESDLILHCSGEWFIDDPSYEATIPACSSVAPPESAIRELLDTIKLQFCAKPGEDPFYAPILSLLPQGIGACLLLPVVLNDDVAAVLEIFLRGAHELDDKVLDELSLVTAQLAPVLYRDMTRSELQNARDELDARVGLRTAELAQLAENLKCEVEQRRQAEFLKEELVATVSHELRTPLASLRGFSELILQRELPRAKQMQLVSVMNKEAIRLTELINDFLDIQRVESGRITCRMEQFLLSHLIDDLVEIFGPQNELHRLELDLTYCPWVRGDQQRLKQALANYLSNAFKYSPKGGTVTISSRLEDPYLVVSVTDSGMGIAPEAIEKLFTRFYRVDNADTRAIGGTGLGLALAKSIAEAHNGTVRVESSPGKGSTFSICLPDHFDGVTG